MNFKPLSIFTGILVLFILHSGCSSSKSNPDSEANKIRESTTPTRPKNVILLIGDGMGLTQISTLHQDQDNLSAFNRFSFIGLINTSSASHKITDSAAGATAFASGIKTYNNAIGMDVDSMPVPILTHWFDSLGFSTGLVSTSSITHATPACFYAHAKSRNMQYDIARQLIASKVDFFAGGGRKFFRDDFAAFQSNNWIIDTSQFFPSSFEPTANNRYGFLLAEDGMPKMSEGRDSFSTSAGKAAIKYLNQNSNGFFLMIEGSQIDWGGHNNDYEYVVSEMKDFNETLNAILDFAEKDKNTLVIVTADHETGGLALSPKEVTGPNGKSYSDYGQVEGRFNTGGHTNPLIPVFSFGPGADQFKGIYQNKDIYQRIKALYQ